MSFGKSKKFMYFGFTKPMLASFSLDIQLKFEIDRNVLLYKFKQTDFSRGTESIT